MASLIQLNVRETGRVGEVRVDIAVPGPMDVTIWSCPDTFERPEISEWTEIGEYAAPLAENIILPNGDWSLLVATGVYLSQFQISAAFRVKPYNNLPYYQIDVIRESIETYVVARTTAYRLKLEAKNAMNLSDSIFLYEKVPAEPLGSELKDAFVAVCKPGDLETYPAGAPDPEQVMPFYRLSGVDIVEENIFKLEEDADAIINDVRELLLALEANRNLTLDSVYRLGGGGTQTPPLELTMGVAGLPQSTSVQGVLQQGNLFRYDFSGYTWTPEAPTSIFVNAATLDSGENPTIAARFVQIGGQEVTYTGLYAGTVPTYGHQYDLGTPVALQELKWIEAMYIL